MRTYVIRRLLLFIPSLFILSMLVFFSVRLLPGDAADLLAHRQEFAAVEIDMERLREIMGLNVPAHIQYVRWMSGILLRGTLGQSLLRGHTPVEEKILGRVPVTLELGAAALIIGLLIALPVGIYSALRQDTLGDYLVSSQPPFPNRAKQGCQRVPTCDAGVRLRWSRLVGQPEG